MLIKKSRIWGISFSSFVVFIILSLLIILLIGNVSAQNDGNSSPPDASFNTIQDSSVVYSKVGRIATYILILRNRGDQRENFYIDVESENNWELDINPQTGIGLSPDESIEIKITFTIPRTLNEDYYKFNIIAKSRSTPAGETTIHAIVSHQDVIITAALRPVLIITPFKEQLDIISPGEQLELDIEVKCFVVSAEVYLESQLLKITDSKSFPDKNLSVSTTPERKTIQKGDSYVFTIIIEFPEIFDEKVDYTCRLRIQAQAEGWEAISKPIMLNFLVYSEPDDNAGIFILANPIYIVGISSILIVGIIGAAISSNEVSKFWFLTALFIPLYTKLHKDKILDHFTRGRVYEYIRNNPGAHYSEIKRELDLNNGNLTYHLHTLEREALIKSRTKGRFKVFYPMDVKIPIDMEPQISNIRRQILDIIREHPGISQKELGLQLPTKKQRTISYHIKNMAREGVITLEKYGRETKCFISESTIEIKQETGKDEQSKDEGYSHKYIKNDSILRQI